MEKTDPKIQAEITRAADKLQAIVELPVYEYLATQWYKRWRAVHVNPRENPAKIAGIERELGIANAMHLNAKQAEAEFEAEVERLFSPAEDEEN